MYILEIKLLRYHFKCVPVDVKSLNCIENISKKIYFYVVNLEHRKRMIFYVAAETASSISFGLFYQKRKIC